MSRGAFRAEPSVRCKQFFHEVNIRIPCKYYVSIYIIYSSVCISIYIYDICIQIYIYIYISTILNILTKRCWFKVIATSNFPQTRALQPTNQPTNQPPKILDNFSVDPWIRWLKKQGKFPSPKVKTVTCEVMVVHDHIKPQPYEEIIFIWMFPKIVGFSPKSSILVGFLHYFHPSIFGIPLFLETRKITSFWCTSWFKLPIDHQELKTLSLQAYPPGNQHISISPPSWALLSRWFSQLPQVGPMWSFPGG